MPSEEAHFVYGYPKRGHGHSYITAQEIAGIGILTVILGILLFLGCWYCRRRSGYRSLKVAWEFFQLQYTKQPRIPRTRLAISSVRKLTGDMVQSGGSRILHKWETSTESLNYKNYMQRSNGIKVSESIWDKSFHAGILSALTGRCPREGLGHQDSKLHFLENNYEPVVPNAPPAYEKLSTQQSPPPYSP